VARPPYILVVEDDEMTADLRCQHLEARGYLVTHCGDAEQFIIQTSAIRVGLVIMDIMLPVYGSGIDAYRRLRANHRVPRNLPVLFLTGIPHQQAERIIPKNDPHVRLLLKAGATIEKIDQAIRELVGDRLLKRPG
jgi:CheY-like chemotaxis protein